MAPRAKKKPGDDAPRRRKRGDLAPSGRRYEGAVAMRCLRSGTRVAVWRREAMAYEDEPAVVGVFLGIQAPRDDFPVLAIAGNGDTTKVPLGDVGAMCEMRADQALPTPEDR